MNSFAHFCDQPARGEREVANGQAVLESPMKRLLNYMIDEVLFALILIGIALMTAIMFPYVSIANHLSGSVDRPIFGFLHPLQQ